MPTAHLGHCGGLQLHSIGPDHPCTVALRADGGRVVHCHGAEFIETTAKQARVRVELLRHVDQVATLAWQELQRSGGFTVSPTHGGNPRLGYIASRFGSEEQYPAESLRFRDVFFYFLRKWTDVNINTTSEAEFIGGWTEAGIVYLDVSRHFASRGNALRFAAENQQRAIFDIGNGTDIRVEP